MIALEMTGPTKDVVVPRRLKKEKKRNSLPRGVTSEIYASSKGYVSLVKLSRRERGIYKSESDRNSLP